MIEITYGEEKIKFASQEDFAKWREDFITYGSAFLDQDGKYIPFYKGCKLLEKKQ